MRERNDIFIECLLLHEHPECMSGCIDVLCEEWGRSRTARSVMLEKSCNEMPLNIAFVERQNRETVKVIGHSRLCVVAGQARSAFVESVVISKSKRGQGLGRRLMEETEKIAIQFGITTLYLTTTDKQNFYERVGYSFCQPVVSLGSASKLLSASGLQKLFGRVTTSEQPLPTTNTPTVPSLPLAHSPVTANEPHPIKSHSCFITPPLPSPLPLTTNYPGRSPSFPDLKPQIRRVDVHWMKKILLSSH